MRKTVTGLILAGLLGLALTGCWGDDASQPGPYPTPTHTNRPWTSPQPAPEYTPAPDWSAAPDYTARPDATMAPQGRRVW